MGMVGNNEPFMVAQGFIVTDAVTRSITIPAPGMTASSHIYYALILAEDFQAYYSEEYANMALGFERVNNTKNPNAANTFTYLYTVNSKGTSGDYFSTKTTVTQNTNSVMFSSSQNEFRVGFKLQYIIIYKE